MLARITLVTCAALAFACGHAHHEDRDDPATAAPSLALSVDLGGDVIAWQGDELAKVPHHPGANRQGDARDVWSLRDVVHTLVGPTARVVAVTGVDGTTAIPDDAWADDARTPILHTTRRGTLKFRWASADGTWQEAAVKDVTKLAIVR